MSAVPDAAGAGPEISLVLPAFNARAVVASSVERAQRHFEETARSAEILVVDDGSSDGTADAVADVPGLRVLRLPHRGKGAALRAGMTAARGAIRAFTDADLPYGLEPLDAAIELIRTERAHAVIGDRTLHGSTYRSAPIRRALSAAGSLTFRTVAGSAVRDTQCGFKAFRGDVAAETFRLATVDGFAIDIEVLFLLLHYGLVVQAIPVRLEGGGGQSSVRLVRDSLAAVLDVAGIRLRWARGQYRSRALEALAT